MKYLYESFEEFKYRLEEDGLTEELFVLVDESLTHSEINDIMQINEIFGLKSLFRSIFVNPGIKRKIKGLVEDLVKLRVEIAKISLEFNEDEFEDEYSLDDESDSQNKPTRDRSPRELKKSTLEDQVEAIEAKMDMLAGEDERLLNYLKMQRLEAKIKANDLIYKLASSEQQKILKKYNKDVKKEIKGIEGILDESEIMNESEAYIEVSVRDARKALNHLDDMHKRKYKTDGSNYYIFKDEEEAYDALQHFEDMGIEVLDHNISESLNESALIKKHLANIKSGFNKFIENVKKENRETKEAFAKIIKSVKDGEKLTKEERKEIGDQMKDVLKLTGFTAASVLPGGMIYILLAQVPALKKTLTPSAFLNESEEEVENDED